MCVCVRTCHHLCLQTVIFPSLPLFLSFPVPEYLILYAVLSEKPQSHLLTASWREWNYRTSTGQDSHYMRWFLKTVLPRHKPPPTPEMQRRNEWERELEKRRNVSQLVFVCVCILESVCLPRTCVFVAPSLTSLWWKRETWVPLWEGPASAVPGWGGTLPVCCLGLRGLACWRRGGGGEWLSEMAQGERHWW